MATPAIEITYAAHTSSCTFLLDSEGICRRIVMAPTGKRSVSRTAARCVGAQYVASLDGSAAGGLVEMPRVGAAMLFARVDERGRISLVRTSAVISFESQAAEDPFLESASVETSAPDLRTEGAPASEERTYRRSSSPDPEPDYYDPSERTQRIQALRPEDVAAALDMDEQESRADRGEEHELGNDLATAEYYAAQEDYAARQSHASAPPPRSKLPSIASHAPHSAAPTLRAPHRDTVTEDEDSYAKRPVRPGPPAPPARGILPRRSDPHQRAAAAAARAYPPPARDSSPRPAPRASDVQIARRRRG